MIGGTSGDEIDLLWYKRVYSHSDLLYLMMTGRLIQMRTILRRNIVKVHNVDDDPTTSHESPKVDDDTKGINVLNTTAKPMGYRDLENSELVSRVGDTWLEGETGDRRSVGYGRRGRIC